MSRGRYRAFPLLIGWLVVLLSPLSLRGQTEVQPSFYSANAVSLGGLLLSDEYLSPLDYGGMTVGVRTDNELPLSKRLPLMQHSNGALSYGLTFNPARSAGMHFVRAELHTETLYLWSLPHGIKLAAGPGIRTTFGGRLHTRNGNNPSTIDAKGDLTIGGLLAYRLPNDNWPIAFRLRTAYGVFGVANRLGYGESYYEQEFVREGIVRAAGVTHPFNTHYLNSSLSVDVPLWNVCTLHLGYQWSYDYSRLKERVRSVHSHVGFVGFSFEGLYFRGRNAAKRDTHRTVLFDMND